MSDTEVRLRAIVAETQSHPHGMTRRDGQTKQLAEVLLAVLKLHKKYDSEMFGLERCDACMTWYGDTKGYAGYPCPTIRVITDALGEV